MGLRIPAELYKALGAISIDGGVPLKDLLSGAAVEKHLDNALEFVPVRPDGGKGQKKTDGQWNRMIKIKRLMKKISNDADGEDIHVSYWEQR